MTFEPFPKMARLSRECIISEKIDGTNAQVVIGFIEGATPVASFDGVHIYAGSRSRFILPGKATDNFGFAGWVFDNADELLKLGEGRHFGEWWGKGIQRGYGLNEKRFSLFNTHVWALERPACCHVVPVLWQGEFCTSEVDRQLHMLHRFGSRASPGFMNPEGVVVWHAAGKVGFKKTFDDKHKEAA